MYAILLAKQQSKLVMCLCQKQQMHLISLSLKKSANLLIDHMIRNYTLVTTEKYRNKPSHIRTWSNQRFHDNNTQQLDEHIKQEKLSNADKEINWQNFCVVKEKPTVQNYNLKELLYTEVDDIMKHLNSTTNIAEIKSVLEAEKSRLHKEHIIQSLILHWMFNRHIYSTHQPIQKSEQDFTAYILSLLKDFASILDINELSTCYLYLRKMRVDNSHPVLQTLLMNALSEIESTEFIIELPALSRLLVAINTGKEFFTPLLCASFIRHLRHHIDLLKSEADARMIAICLSNLQVIIDDEMVALYKKKVHDLISSGQISSATPKTVIKILNSLNTAVWSNRHVSLIRELVKTLASTIKQLGANDLISICRVYHYHLEPAFLHETLSKAMEELLSQQMSPETLACFVPLALPQRRENLINAFKTLIASPKCWKLPYSAGYLFSILRGLKLSDTNICNAYWNGVLAELETSTDNETQLCFLKHCHRYMNFNNNLGGTYRHIVLEKKLSRLCMKAIEHDLDGKIPKQFARLASFVLAYGHTPYSWKKYPNIILSKIITMGEQFTPKDCFVLSRGLHISLELRYRKHIPQLVRLQLSKIDNVLTACIEKHLDDKELTIIDLNMLVSSISNRKSLKNSVIYHKALEKYKEIKLQDFNSRLIREMTYNFMTTNYLVPELLDKMFTYIENNHEYVGGETVERLLTCAYNLGYTPQSPYALDYAGAILLRDFNYMSGLSLVHACLALCFYKAVPEELINKVFCINFIQRVEDEIQKCYSKATYPERVFNIVMQLNRSVCLDFPEANVPWFQQSFIEAQISKKPPKESHFNRNVKKSLTALLKNESYIRCNHITPYGYQIDFIINFDKDKNPIEASVETTMLDRITKVAILLLKLDSFCENDLNALRGPDSLKIKHLEMMGYKVLHISEHDWNSKCMAVRGAKQNYLKCLLQITNKQQQQVY